MSQKLYINVGVGSIAHRLLAVVCLGFGALTSAAEPIEGDGAISVSRSADNAVTLYVDRPWPGGCEPEDIEVTVNTADVLVRGWLPAQGCGTGTIPISVELSADFPVARLTFLQQRRPLSEDQLVDFTLVPLTAAQTHPESGLWWGEDGGVYETRGPGTAMSLDIQGNRLAATVNVYHPDGQPVWYFSAGEFTGLTFSAPMHGFAQGQTLFGDYRRPSQAVEVGRLQLEFHSPGQATAWLTAPDHTNGGLDLQPVSLVRFDFQESESPDRLSGRWIFVQLENPSQELVLSPPMQRSGRWEYVDLVAGLILACELDASRPRSLPDACTLEQSDGLWQVEFKQVGLDRMSGVDRLGNPAYAFRLDWHAPQP